MHCIGSSESNATSQIYCAMTANTGDHHSRMCLTECYGVNLKEGDFQYHTLGLGHLTVYLVSPTAS